MVKKSEMTEPMLRDREQVLDETVELMLVKERYGLNFSVANTIYNKTCWMKATKKAWGTNSNQNETWKILDKTKHYSGQAMRVLGLSSMLIL